MSAQVIFIGRILAPFAVAVLTVACVHSRQPSTATDALAALAGHDCIRVGELVNAGLEEKQAALMYVAGILYDEGLCAEQSAERARSFFEAAGAIGDLRAATEIGLRYALGDGLPQSYRKAGAWLCHADVVWQDHKVTRSECKSPPSFEESVEAEWKGYLLGVAMLASRMVRYPPDAQRGGHEGTVLAVLCVRNAPAMVAVKQDSTPSASDKATSAHPSLSAAVQSGFERSIRILPVPDHSSGLKPLCAQRPFNFAFR